jgi:hypothetical protein
MSCRTGPLRVGRPLRGVYTSSRKDNLLWSSRWSEKDDPDQREGPGNPFLQDKIKRRANARPNRGPRKQVFVCGVAERSGPVRQDTVFTLSQQAQAFDIPPIHPVPLQQSARPAGDL